MKGMRIIFRKSKYNQESANYYIVLALYFYSIYSPSMSFIIEKLDCK